MELIMNLLRAALIGLLAYGICRWGAARDISWLRLRGRINRLLFIVLYVLLSIIMYSFNALTLTMMDAIVTYQPIGLSEASSSSVWSLLHRFSLFFTDDAFRIFRFPVFLVSYGHSLSSLLLLMG